MDIYESLYSSSFELNEQITRQIFEVLPEQAPVVVIVDRAGNVWPSDSEKFTKLNISDSLLKDLRSRIDDGQEPVIYEENDCSLVAAQLATDRTNCGYIIFAVPKYNPESILAEINMIEMVINQFCLIAKLIEKNNILLEHHAQAYQQDKYNVITLN